MTAPHLRPNELAERWRISPKMLARWRWTGDGPKFLKVSGRVLYRLGDIEAFEAAQLRSRTDEHPMPTIVQPFRPKRGKRRNHVTLAWPPVSGDRRRALPR